MDEVLGAMGFRFQKAHPDFQRFDTQAEQVGVVGDGRAPGHVSQPPWRQSHRQRRDTWHWPVLPPVAGQPGDAGRAHPDCMRLLGGRRLDGLGFVPGDDQGVFFFIVGWRRPGDRDHLSSIVTSRIELEAPWGRNAGC